MIIEMTVWSGDTVRMDEDSFLYIIGQCDQMLKPSDCRVSLFERNPKEDACASGLVAAAGRGQTPARTTHCSKPCDRYVALMVPAKINRREGLQRNLNGKYDRSRLAEEFRIYLKIALHLSTG